MKEIFNDIFENYEHKMISDEWYLSKEFEKLSDNLSSVESFDLLPDIMDAIMELEDNLLIWYMIYFMINIYRKLKTTEVHRYITNNWNDFENHISDKSDSCIRAYDDLCKYLRKK